MPRRPIAASPPRRLRVAVVAPSLRILGGQAVQADRLLRAWRADPEIEAYLVPINPLPPPVLARLTQLKYVRTIVTQLFYWPLLFRELRRADVVHVFSAAYSSFLLSPLPAFLVARLLGKPAFINYHSGEAPDHLARSRIARAVLRRSHTNVVPSSFLAAVFAKFGLRAELIPNVVDLTRFRFARRRPIRPRLVSTRNLESLYNVDCTLRAFSIVQSQYSDASLTLVGAGSEEQRLRERVAELHLRNVKFEGAVAPDEIWRRYAEADIYVQTPNIDNVPCSVFEAFASGLPVVSTDAGGISTILSDGVHGLLGPVGDYEAVARQVLRLLEDQSLADRLTDSAFATCGAYTWDVVRSTWLSLYRRLARCRSTETAGAAETDATLVLRRPAGAVMKTSNEMLDLRSVANSRDDLELVRRVQTKESAMIDTVVVRSADNQQSQSSQASAQVRDHHEERLIAEIAPVQDVRGADHVKPILE
ncbi:MAG TPA: glycosyltransferase family 4 protein [Gemmatimonadaceae bacterium]|jgi:glycosyltransferase involved in cell wall biosynthesis